MEVNQDFVKRKNKIEWHNDIEKEEGPQRPANEEGKPWLCPDNEQRSSTIGNWRGRETAGGRHLDGYF